MNDSERYADSMVGFGNVGSLDYQHCARFRCNNKVLLQKQDGEVLERRWRYESDVVIVSIDDGTRKMAFCSMKCASLKLATGTTQ